MLPKIRKIHFNPKIREISVICLIRDQDYTDSDQGIIKD